MTTILGQNRTTPDLNLTEWEVLALQSQLNLADGHPRQDFTPSQWKIIDSFPQMFRHMRTHTIHEVEQEAIDTFMATFGQQMYPRDPDRVMLCYSSSVAMEIFARAITQVSNRVALVSPTFDNIPDLLRGNGIDLIPIAESDICRGIIDEDLLREVGAVFLTSPNNPTGAVIDEQSLRAIATRCAEHDVLLALDCCFRAFDTRTHYDHYAVLEDSGCRWVVIEDTGKIWPTLELKVGIMVSSADVGIGLAKIHSDILLGVSPVLLRMITLLALDYHAGGMKAHHAFIAENRSVLRAELDDIPHVTFCGHDTRVSVEMFDVGSRLSTDVWSQLSDRNVFVLPCQPFFWNRPQLGDHLVRVSLSRDPDRFRQAAREIADVLRSGR